MSGERFTTVARRWGLSVENPHWRRGVRTKVFQWDTRRDPQFEFYLPDGEEETRLAYAAFTVGCAYFQIMLSSVTGKRYFLEGPELPKCSNPNCPHETSVDANNDPFTKICRAVEIVDHVMIRFEKETKSVHVNGYRLVLPSTRVWKKLYQCFRDHFSEWTSDTVIQCHAKYIDLEKEENLNHLMPEWSPIGHKNEAKVCAAIENALERYAKGETPVLSSIEDEFSDEE